jgi:hypothetical protein
MTLNHLLPLRLADLRDLTDDELREHIVVQYIEADITPDELGTVLIAYESVGDYGCDSSSYFLVERDGELYEVHGGHCSCNGFEGQWTPQRVTSAYLVSPQWSLSCGGYDEQGQQHVDLVTSWLHHRFGGELAELPLEIPALAIPTWALHIDAQGRAVDLRAVDDRYLRNIARWATRRLRVVGRRALPISVTQSLAASLNESRRRGILPTVEDLRVAWDRACARGHVDPHTSEPLTIYHPCAGPVRDGDERPVWVEQGPRDLVELWVGYGRQA